MKKFIITLLVIISNNITYADIGEKVQEVLQKLPDNIDLPAFHYDTKDVVDSSRLGSYGENGNVYLSSEASVLVITHELGHHIIKNNIPKCGFVVSKYALTDDWEDGAETFVLYVYGGDTFRRHNNKYPCMKKKYDYIKSILKKEYSGELEYGYATTF